MLMPPSIIPQMHQHLAGQNLVAFHLHSQDNLMWVCTFKAYLKQYLLLKLVAIEA